MSLRDKLDALDEDTGNLVSLMSAIVTHGVANLKLSPAQIGAALAVIADPDFQALLLKGAPAFQVAARVIADEYLDKDG